ncbi:dipeptidyl carboxypeptidase II [Erythrobacter arachoides]|uniref:Dipeptidyl carboxypeptidase II n=1 Tax=Aurantiacibacter arachoides TaxID=1850444 RepID=A0A845A0W8_9SPHN|nr:M3 family metallopeptidase [Aurantiacibacter arachoides]MXO92766.1 dipeptidyl carboxypeptidase II [Aurantiacibacter arachoides]GGD54656.1 dipeptidyl carboxypeptidase II [Aurantiacibacter arachoides]
MRKLPLLTSTMLMAFAAAGCTTTMPEGDMAVSDPMAYNPQIPTATSIFAEPSPLPFHAPQFNLVDDTSWQGVIEEAIEIQMAEIEAIANNPNPPTFQNTIVALEESGKVYSRATAPFDQLVSANTNDVLNAADAELAPQRAALSSAIYLNPRLFARVKSVYDNRGSMRMTPEATMLLQTTYADFVHEGAQLAPAAQTELRQINERLSALQAEISTDITDGAAAGAIVVNTREELAGLSDGQIAAAAAAANERGQRGKYMLSLSNTTSQPLLGQLQNRSVRERLYAASIARNQSGANNTLPNIAEIIRLRTRIAELFGAPDYATWQMYDRFAQNPETAINFMTQMVPALRATQDREAGVLQARARQDGETFTLQPWDWPYYAEIVRRERYALDNEELKQYFVVENVLEDGIFYMANQLYGLTFEKRNDLPVYDDSITVYTVRDADGSDLALFYFDPFARDNKSGGAWMNNYVEQSRSMNMRPVISNTLNIVPPAEGQPALATWDDVTTMFHEFGHALHGMFADQEFTSLSGTNTARDWVEFPSQFHEPFAARPEVMQRYARHWQTGEVIPDRLVQAIDRSSRFDQGYSFGEVISASLLDMEWHALSPDEVPTDVMAFEQQALGGLGLRTDLVPPRYKTPYFRHIWNHGYQAGYYSYTWTEMLAHDAYEYVVENGGMNRRMGDRIRRTFLGQGHSKSYDEMYRDFTGHAPRVEPLLEARGLVAADDGTQADISATGAE